MTPDLGHLEPPGAGGQQEAGVCAAVIMRRGAHRKRNSQVHIGILTRSTLVPLCSHLLKLIISAYYNTTVANTVFACQQAPFMFAFSKNPSSLALLLQSRSHTHMT